MLNLPNWLVAVLAVLLALIAIAGLWFTAAQLATAYFLRRQRPDKPDPPSNYQIGYEEVYFHGRDGMPLVGWWIPCEHSIGTVIMCHGRAGSMDGDTRQMVPLHNAGFSVLMFDFRGHGHSGGQWVTMGMYEKEDLLGAVDYLLEKRGIKKVGVLGFSMGAATALISAALSERIAVIVADSSFGRLKWTMAAHLRERHVPDFIARVFVNSIVALASIETEGRIDHTDPIRWTVHIGPRPILFIYGEDDCLVSLRDVDRMVTLAEGPTEVWYAEDANHREAYSKYPDEYNARVVAWFKQYLSVEVSQPVPEKTAEPA
jgi:uncharacterized protein